MNTRFKICITILLYIFISACTAIPYNTRTTAVCKVGERYSSEGELTSYIEKRAMQDDIYVLIGPDGSFKNTRYIYYNYFIKNKDLSETRIPFLDKYASTKRYFEPILPIENTDYWITFWEARDKTYLKAILNIEFDNFDYIVFIVVFDKNGIIYNQYVPEVKYNWDYRNAECCRECCGHGCFHLIKEYLIEATKGNHIIKFKTSRGNYIYHVDGNILEKENN